LFKFSSDPSNESIEPFHKSIRDWLGNPTSSGDFYVDEDEGHLMLGTALWEELCSQGENLSDYGAIELPYHLLRLEKSALNNLIPNENIWEKHRDACIGISKKIPSRLKGKSRSSAIIANATETWWRFILTIDESTFGNADPKTAKSLRELADVLNLTRQHSENEIVSRRALEIEKKEDPNSMDTLDCLMRLARALEGRQLSKSQDAESQKSHIEAESYLRQALKIQENSPRTWRSVHNLISLANNLMGQKRYAEAKVYYLELFNMTKINGNLQDITRLVECLDAWCMESDVSWNEDQKRHALAIDRSWTLEKHRHELAAEAKNYHLQLIKIYEDRLSQHPSDARNLESLYFALLRFSRNLYAQGRDDEAKICEERAKEIR
jgi:tetratricopeptide (TPR) repeat protein